jgi:hypothetical protein
MTYKNKYEDKVNERMKSIICTPKLTWKYLNQDESNVTMSGTWQISTPLQDFGWQNLNGGDNLETSGAYLVSKYIS